MLYLVDELLFFHVMGKMDVNWEISHEVLHDVNQVQVTVHPHEVGWPWRIDLYNDLSHLDCHGYEIENSPNVERFFLILSHAAAENGSTFSKFPNTSIEMILLIKQILIGDVWSDVERCEHTENDDLDLLEKEFNYHLKSFDFVQIKIVLVEDSEKEFLSFWLLDNPANTEANYMDWVALIIRRFLHIVGKELLVNIDWWGVSHRNDPVVKWRLDFENLFLCHLLRLNWQALEIVREAMHINQVWKDLHKTSTCVVVYLRHEV